MPEASIGTDIMVGFPNESELNFNNSYNLLKESELTYFHVFPYSKRKHTSAASMEEQIHPTIKKERSKILRQLSSAKKYDFYSGFVGKNIDTLIENRSRGTSSNYINVKIENNMYQPGDIINLNIKRIDGEYAVA